MVFAATILISLALYLPALLRFALSLNFFAALSSAAAPNYWPSISQTLVVSLIEVPIGFAFFYYFAKKTNVHLDRSVVAALLAGVFVGNIPFILLPCPLGWVNVFASTGYLMNTYLGTLQTNIFCVFFPALVAFLFVELNSKRANNSPILPVEAPSTE